MASSYSAHADVAPCTVNTQLLNIQNIFFYNSLNYMNSKYLMSTWFQVESQCTKEYVFNWSNVKNIFKMLHNFLILEFF